MNPFIYATEAVAGLDFSLRNPCICVIPPSDAAMVCVPFETCQFYYLTNVQSHALNQGNIHGDLIGVEKHPEKRYGSLAEWVMATIKENNVTSIGIENYAFGANSSSLTKLAEACGLVKWFLHTHGVPYTLYSPSQVKKFATSKGNADKDMMYLAWLGDTNIELNALYGRGDGAKIKSPIHDMVDAYYIACMARLEMLAINGKYSGEFAGKDIIITFDPPKDIDNG